MTTPAAPKARQLSSSLLGMRFMQRQREQEEQKRVEQEEKRTISEAHWAIRYSGDDAKQATTRQAIKYEPSFLSFEETSTLGRQSFRQFNKEVDKLARTTAEQQQADREEEKERRQGLSDEQMAGWYADRDKPRKQRVSAAAEGKGKGKRSRKDSDSDTVPGAKRHSSPANKQQEPSGVDVRGDGFLRPVDADEDN
ncbi:M-phase phospho protein 6-domain-containing protein [Thamnocephalis sphaerospora]|uniref:M-phase phospho protein 6-domain-containing protein n=1 Tax=Thamnocephalis sphaerospora TaxID=78915 RepID=A0A4P9XJ10_9FUNG|nr:M-phase phospho protein 6-domain-containing protein [Thamnocephalis sphaerospora]|eukprot:RKP05351.1 M-phase phospho protein 6-domain-containing protein [Thamnocephalis sphaerospora]